MKTLWGSLVLVGLVTGLAKAQEETSRYEVTEQAGPWMVLAHSFKAEHPKFYAEQLVEILRKQNLPAYTVSLEKMRARWDQGKKTEWFKVAREQEQKRMTIRYREWAVVIGGYKDMATARKVIDYMRAKVPFPVLRDPQGREFRETLQVYDTKDFNTLKLQKQALPMAWKTAFVIRNPAIQPEKKKSEAASRWDPAWKQLNAGEEYSLLEVKRKWTLVVAQFNGVAVLQEQGIGGRVLDLVGLNDTSRKLLNANARQAHEVAKLLRHYKIPAYVLHTKSSSIVTVGEYDSKDGEEIQDMRRRMATFRLKGSQLPIPFFTSPLPMEVPRF